MPTSASTTDVAVRDLDPDDISGEYRRRRLSRLPDADLVDAVATVLAEPRADAPDSFVLHAPLELLARAALLPLVSPGVRERARQQMVSIAARFEAFGPRSEGVEVAFAGPNDARDALVAALASGDLDCAAAAGRALGRALDADRLTGALGEPVVASLAAAAHASIFLHHLPRATPRSSLAGAMFGTLARELARHPDWALRWADGDLTGEGDLAEALSATPVLGSPGSDFIFPLMDQAEASGVAAEVVGGAVGATTDLDAATRSIVRTATASMLLDDETHAPYGWSHCLTIPQAVLTTARVAQRPQRSIAIAATHVVGFRAALGSAPLCSLVGPTGSIGPDALVPGLEPLDQPEIQAMVDHAAAHEDAHLTKYVVSCFDAARVDPGGATQHLRAAAHLDRWWHRRDV